MPLAPHHLRCPSERLSRAHPMKSGGCKDGAVGTYGWAVGSPHHVPCLRRAVPCPACAVGCTTCLRHTEHDLIVLCCVQPAFAVLCHAHACAMLCITCLGRAVLPQRIRHEAADRWLMDQELPLGTASKWCSSSSRTPTRPTPEVPGPRPQGAPCCPWATPSLTPTPEVSLPVPTALSPSSLPLLTAPTSCSCSALHQA